MAPDWTSSSIVFFAYASIKRVPCGRGCRTRWFWAKPLNGLAFVGMAIFRFTGSVGSLRDWTYNCFAMVVKDFCFSLRSRPPRRVPRAPFFQRIGHFHEIFAPRRRAGGVRISLPLRGSLIGGACWRLGLLRLPLLALSVRRESRLRGGPPAGASAIVGANLWSRGRCESLMLGRFSTGASLASY